MWQAIFTLLGVALGGVITFVATYSMERRRERRGARSAARLVQEEFMDGMTSATSAVYLTRDNEPITRLIDVTDRVWLEHRAVLASALDSKDWETLVWATKHRREFMAWIRARQSRFSGQTQLFADDLTKTKLQKFMYEANNGWDALSKAAGFSLRQRRSIGRMREADRQAQRAASDGAAAERPPPAS